MSEKLLRNTNWRMVEKEAHLMPHKMQLTKVWNRAGVSQVCLKIRGSRYCIVLQTSYMLNFILIAFFHLFPQRWATESAAMNHTWKMDLTTTPIKALLIDSWSEKHASHPEPTCGVSSELTTDLTLSLLVMMDSCTVLFFLPLSCLF